jgi:hypothetical protein
MYPCPQFLELILQRAREGPIELDIFVRIREYKGLFKMIQDVLPDITYLSLAPHHSMGSLTDLYPILSHLYLPSLTALKVSTSFKLDVKAAYMFIECLLAVAARSKVDQLSLVISCHVETLVEILNRSQIFSRVKSLSLEVGEYPQYLPHMWH